MMTVWRFCYGSGILYVEKSTSRSCVQYGNEHEHDGTGTIAEEIDGCTLHVLYDGYVSIFLTRSPFLMSLTMLPG